jgi:3-oxoacyl-[acyl-carrier protein] reductase
MFSLNGFNALVTGASGGIGGAVAKALATQGSNLVISGTRQEALENLSKQLHEINSKIIVKIITCNLKEKSSVENLFLNAENELGSIDILVNNAGITKDNLFMRMKDEEWNDVVDVNLNSVFILTRIAVKSMMKKRYGRIINISSVVGFSGNPGQANYCATKAGIVGMSKAVAREVAIRGITVNCVAPGFIESDMTQNLSDSVKEKIFSNIPTQRMGLPEEVASCVAFLASKEASYVTGSTIHVNGGLQMY